MRSVPEWIGKNDDTPIPARVRLRVWEKFKGCCATCSRKIASGEKWECDHHKALANGGENTESNLQVLCCWCHKRKTGDDVAIKSYFYRRRLANAGIKPKRRYFPGSRNSPWKITFSRGVVRR